jgi:hypothetical protein
MADYAVESENGVYFINQKSRDEFRRLYELMKADAVKIEEGRNIYGPTGEGSAMAEDKRKRENITQILDKGFKNSDVPKTRAAAARALLELTAEFVSGLITKEAKYRDADILINKYPTVIRNMKNLTRNEYDIDDAFQQYSALNDDRKKAIDRERKTYKKMLTEFPTLEQKFAKPQADDPVVKNEITENRKFINLYRRFMQKAGIRPPTIPSVRDAPTVAIFCPEFKPRYFEIDEYVATEFRTAAACLSAIVPGQRYEELCARVDEPSKLTLAQQTPFYYSNPNNPTSILLTHSAGSGKTAAMTLANSLYVRAGYLPIIVTTEALAADNTYERAIFVECADWNIQQLLQSSGKRSVIEMAEDLNDRPTVEDVISRGKTMYTKMVDVQNNTIWDSALKITFQTFSSLCYHCLRGRRPWFGDRATSRVWDILCNRAPEVDGKRNFLWKTVILMDEVQTMMDELPPPNVNYDSPNDNQPSFGDIRNVILALWAARENTYEGPVVIAASATPGKSEFELAMILNMLCTASEGYKFTDRPFYDNYRDSADPEALFYHTEKKRLVSAFKAANPNPKKILERMARGRVSYYDASASKSLPPMRVVPVQVELTGEQQRTQAFMLQDLKKKIKLVQKRDGSWAIEKEYGSQFTGSKPQVTVPLKTFTDSAKANAIVAQTSSGDAIVGRVRNNGYFLPPKTRGTGDRVIRTREDYAEWKQIAPIIAPLYTRTIDCLQQNKVKGIRKQYVYINLGANATQGSSLFCKMLGSLLKYRNVEDAKDTNVWNGTYARVTVRNSSKMLDLFNSPENANGSLVDIIVLDRTTKEGVSLYGVGAVYIVGVVDSEIDLVQSVARAFRNCRTNPKELFPTQDVPVLLVTPFANGSPIHSLLNAVNRAEIEQDLKTKELLQILKDQSFDRDILAKENDAAVAAQGQLTKYLE